MKRRIGEILIILIIMLLTISTVAAQSDYVPLTDQEVDAYLQSITIEQLRDDIRKLDYIEHAVPDVVLPPTLYIITSNDLYVYYEEGADKINFKIGTYLEYDVPLKSTTIKNVIPKNKSIAKNVGWFSLGLGLGILTNLIPRR